MSYPSSLTCCSLMAPSVLLLLLLLPFGLLSSVGSLPPPRTSFLLNSAGRQVVFSLPDVHNTTTLLLSDDGATLYVGARDAVLSLDTSRSDVISLKKKVEWSPSEEEISDCHLKGKDPAADCPNFVRVLQLINSTHLYACGSYAYSPHDAFIDAESFSMVRHEAAKSKVRCPFNPLQRNIGVSIDGELFTATTTDFRGAKPDISRHFSRDGRPDVSQFMSVSFLQEPTFVSSSLDPSDRKLYFFFSEVEKEISYVDEMRISRVAQVCKDDVGGQRTLQKKWTSFAKAPLLCRSHKQLPFNVVQDVFTLQPPEGSNSSDTLLYGVFTSQWSLGPESAVCVFSLQDVKAVFAESYRSFSMTSHQWTSAVEKKHSNLGKCGLDSAPDYVLEEAKTTFLTSNSVRPVGDGPIVVSSEQQYSRVAAMRTRAANGRQYTVLFLLAESGFIHKVVLFDGGAQVVEEIEVFTQPQLVKNMVLSPAKAVLYVGTWEGVTAVPVAKCSVYSSCSQCVLARDPLCGWSRTRRVCSRLDGRHDDMAQDVEDANVEEECAGQTRASPDTEVSVHLNQAVRLQCQKPSNWASLTWTSSRFKTLPEKLFIQSADGSLRFLAAADTLGIYRCDAEEGGYKEVVASYDVRQIASPRSMSPKYYEPSEQPVTAATQPSGDGPPVTFKDQSDSRKNNGLASMTSTKDPQTWEEPRGGNPAVTTYFYELVVVSLLLAICICILVGGGLYLRRQRAPGNPDPQVSPEDGGKTNQPVERAPPPSGPEGPEGPEAPEVKLL